jgi:hypothetical protein
MAGGCFDQPIVCDFETRDSLTDFASSEITKPGNHPDDLALSSGSRNEAFVFSLLTFCRTKVGRESVRVLPEMSRSTYLSTGTR